MRQTTTSSTTYAKEVHTVLRLLLAAALALSGLFLAAPAWADEPSGQADAVEGAFVANLEPLAAGDITGWIKNYGGSDSDSFSSVIQTADGGFVAVGTSYSSNGDLSGNRGKSDFIIAKFDANGNKVWLRTYGGSDFDSLSSVIQTSDGDFVAVGYSYSSNGDLPPNRGWREDFVIAKFSANGNKVWLKTYGGSGPDSFSSIIQTVDGGFVVVGESGSVDGDLPGSMGSSVIAKFTANGDKVWLKTYEGSRDGFQTVALTLDGGFVAVGASQFLSDSYRGWDWDFTVGRFDANGEKVWLKNYGERGPDDVFLSVIPTSDGGFVAVGKSRFPYNQTDFINDFVIAKFDATGSKVWSKNYGGSDYSGFRSIIPTSDGGFVAVGSSDSESSDGDAIIAKFDANGNKVWFRNYGGSNDDSFSAVISTSDGGFAAVGSSESSDGNLPGNKGDSDFVIAKFDAEGRLVDDGVTQHAGLGRQETAARASAKAYPDPAQVDSVILAYSYDFPDALAASYLAGALDAPILLCDTDEIPEATASELARLSPDSVYLVGGTGVISKDVEDVLRATPGVSVATRLGGAGREETAYLIACEARDKGGAPTTAFVANAADFPDALTAGSLSASQGVPILLTATGSLDGWASRFLTENDIADIIIVGGAGSVSEGVAAQLRALPHAPSVTRWSGAGRYETSADVLNKAIAKWSLTPTVIGLASGDGFPDALVGGAAVGNRGGLLAITGPDALSVAASDLISTYKDSISGVEIFGGTGTIRVAPEVRRLLA